MKIGEKTLNALGELATNALLAHMGPLNMAYTKNGETDLKINMKGTIKPGAASGNFKLKIDIDYVIEKATDSFSDSVDEKQMSLPLDGPTKVCPERDGDEIITSVCAKCKNREGIFISDGVSLPQWYDGMEPRKIPEGALISYVSCRAWADDDYKSWCDEMERRADIMIAAIAEKKAKPNLKKVMGGKK